MIAFIRPPEVSRYSETEVKEEPIITYFLGYLNSIGYDDYKVFDFHLDETITLDDILSSSADSFVIAVRETGNYIHYARRIAFNIEKKLGRPVYLYGQIGRLGQFKDWKQNTRFIIHDEQTLARALKLPAKNFTYEKNLLAKSYIDKITVSDKRMNRFVASIESSRGCHYGCKFCFINEGVNYPKRFQTRSPEIMLEDIKNYKKLGVQYFVFHDSEFLGADKKNYPRITKFANLLINEKLGIKYMIYCRADTLSRYDNLDILKKSGLSSVFIGVESFDNSDLKYFNKNLDQETLINSIKTLLDNKIFMSLNFILFNKNTTIESIKNNIKVLKDLYKHPNFQYLGTPKYMFSYEASWKKQKSNKLSEKTYIHWILWKKAQAAQGALFNSALEPLLEIYRVFFYEQMKMYNKLHYALPVSSEEDKFKIEKWFHNFGHFVLKFMEYYLGLYESNKLNLKSIESETKNVFKMFEAYNRILPVDLAKVETKEEFEDNIDKNKKRVCYLDHGWDQIISLPEEFLCEIY